ncbi:MAG: NYN domain-containing protein [Rhodobacteraceae bacterium]|nr:NYN domain-containing protein [Paracoccaceae bacterium]
MTKSAILIDGGYFLKRLPSVRPDIDCDDASAVCKAIQKLINSHLKQINKTEGAANHWALLYRSFFYDAPPYLDRGHLPRSGRAIDYARTAQAQFRLALHTALKRMPKMAVRLGEIRPDPDSLWALKPAALRALLKKERKFDDLTDDDFRPTFRQKAVDMRIGLDIASITLKRQADIITLVTGDSDFVPAAKLARREGVTFILDPLWRGVNNKDLFEHIDGLRSGVPRPSPKAKAQQTAPHPAPEPPRHNA